MEFFGLLAHEVFACKRTKEDYQIDGIRCRTVNLDNFQGMILIFTLLIIVFAHFHP